MVVTISIVRAGAPAWDYFSTIVLVSQVQIGSSSEFIRPPDPPIIAPPTPRHHAKRHPPFRVFRALPPPSCSKLFFLLSSSHAVLDVVVDDKIEFLVREAVVRCQDLVNRIDDWL